MPLCPSTTFLLPDRNYIVVANAAARPTGASLFTGLRIYQADISSELTYDGTGWVIMSEPAKAFTPTIGATVGTFTSVAGTTTYHRSDGYLDFNEQITITTNGTASQAMTTTLPVAPAAPQDGIMLAHFREVASTGNTGEGYWNIASSKMYLNLYNNSYPGANGYILQIAGRYRMVTRYS